MSETFVFPFESGSVCVCECVCVYTFEVFQLIIISLFDAHCSIFGQ